MALSKQGFIGASYIIKLIARSYHYTQLSPQLSHSNQLHAMVFQSTDLVMMGLNLLAAEFNFNQIQIPFFPIAS